MLRPLPSETPDTQHKSLGKGDLETCFQDKKEDVAQQKSPSENFTFKEFLETPHIIESIRVFCFCFCFLPLWSYCKLEAM